MSIEQLRAALPSYAQDIKINLGNVLDSDDAALDQTTRYRIALATAYATRNADVYTAVEAQARGVGFSDGDVHAARLAATLMAMNNIYYRFLHLAQAPELQKIPARLRMQGLANHGIDKAAFELMALGVSAINGCGMCIEAHTKEVQKHGITLQGVQETARIAAVIFATAQALSIN